MRFAVLVLGGADIDPGLASAIVVDHPLLVGVSEWREKALACKVSDEAWLRQHGNVGRAACLGVDHDLLLIVLRRGVFYVSARGLTEIFENDLYVGLVVATPRTEYGEGFTLEINLFQVIKIGPMELGIFAGFVFQFSKGWC